MFWFGKKKPVELKPAAFPQGRMVRAKFDAAMTTLENARHWANADYLSPDLAAAPEVRSVWD